MNTAKMLTLGLLGGSGAAFSPLDIPGMALWLDASDSATLFQDSAGTVPATADNDVVGRWADKSGNARHATQVTTGSKPLLKLAQQNGRNVVQFDGTDDALAATFNSIAVTAETVIAVFNPIISPNYYRVVTQGNGVTHDNEIPNGLIPIIRLLPNMKWYSSLNGVYYSSVVPSVFEAPFLMSCRHNGIRVLNRGNGVDGSPATVTLNQSVSEFVLARRSGANDTFWPGKLMECLIWLRELSVDELAATESYLNTKWGVY